MNSNEQKLVKRTFIIGDEWLYFKIYTGVKTSDFIITNIIFPYAQSLVEKSIINKWFFLRYADPKPHLRLRLNFSDSVNLHQIIKEFNFRIKPLVEQDYIWKIQIDTYSREIERYGVNSIEISEKMFFNDSVMISGLIRQLKDDNLRWLFSLKAVDSFLTSFHFSNIQKRDFLEKLKSNFAKEFNISKFQNKQIDKKYRLNRDKIENIMYENHMDSREFQFFFSLIRIRDKKNEILIENILSLKKDKNLKVDFNSFISSHIHMIMNRLFRSKNRLNEMVCYDFLFRFYKSDVARKRLKIN
ncbi:MAG: hypothetical protein GY756_25845 [bacterium]|nr:hypothetical protein [bacterium]